MRYYHEPWPGDRKGVLCLTFDVDVEYAYTKGTQTWGALSRWLGLDALLAGGLSVESRGYHGLHAGLPRLLEQAGFLYDSSLFGGDAPYRPSV